MFLCDKKFKTAFCTVKILDTNSRHILTVNYTKDILLSQLNGVICVFEEEFNICSSAKFQSILRLSTWLDINISVNLGDMELYANYNGSK